MGKVLLLFLSLSLISLLGGCSSSAPRAEVIIPKNRAHRVSVFQGKNELKNFASPLIHRVAVRRSSLRLISNQGLGLMPFSFSLANDSYGQVKGLKVRSKRTTADLRLQRALAFGLKHGDVITAVNQEHIQNKRELYRLFSSIQIEKKATLTLEREGTPHKIFYDLSS